MNRIELELKEHGFKLVKTYGHDQYTSRVFARGCLIVDLTYEKNKLVDSYLSIEDVECIPMSMDKIKQLIPILG